MVGWNKTTIFVAEIINRCDMEAIERLIGRERECEKLKWAMDSHRSELIVMYGRLRVGKTLLVRRFFNDTYSFHYVGAHKQKKECAAE